MKSIIISTFAFALFAMGGLPYIHGLSGKDWGMGVNGLAKSYPGAVADHIRD